MKMWRPERALVGPRLPTERDIPALNRIFSESFTDRYRRDGLVGVRVPQLNPHIWRYALSDAGEGAMVWLDEHDEVVAFNIAHRSGSEGWMGPLAVRPDRQGLGVGKAIVQTAIDWLKERGVTTIGLETMPRTVDNIGFYTGLGFLPGHLTVTMTADVRGESVRGAFMRLSQHPPDEQGGILERCRRPLDACAPGVDFTGELALTQALGIGDTVLVEQGGAVRAFALVHSAALAEARAADELRVLKLFAESEDAFDRIIVALEHIALKLKIRRVAIRCQTAYQNAYRALTQRGYRVRWTDLRMTLDGYPEAVVPAGKILFSNWEI